MKSYIYIPKHMTVEEEEEEEEEEELKYVIFSIIGIIRS
jgi:hypothetical protein